MALAAPLSWTSNEESFGHGVRRDTCVKGTFFWLYFLFLVEMAYVFAIANHRVFCKVAAHRGSNDSVIVRRKTRTPVQSVRLSVGLSKLD